MSSSERVGQNESPGQSPTPLPEGPGARATHDALRLRAQGPLDDDRVPGESRCPFHHHFVLLT
eukprot:5246059-Pyramimonas_sp.AAC.1